eukprot:GILJ01002424.1.p1 GENE.GILJ01002424.1~~GILJ01002424.1.p1  ORF type:complete len:345 (-),score=49.94 GILJ01002424.1:109-1143(-)
MHVVDLRSDTVTKPTDAMKRAMVTCQVGDDVYGDDPTVNQLEARVAELLNKEAGLFVPSGTMGNLVSVLSHCGRGDEMIVGDEAHIHYYEQGNVSTLGSVHPRALKNNPDGTIDLALIENAIREDNVHYPRTKLVCLENTHNRCGGAILPTSYVDSVGALCASRGIKLHIDGARLANAAIALEEDMARMVQAADSVSFCLSKGLGCPVGSVVVGSASFIASCRRWRKALGGGMRQAGVLAAAGLVALDDMARLKEDHANAKLLAAELNALPGLSVNMASVQTNIVVIAIEKDGVTAADLVKQLKDKNIWLNAVSPTKLRVVTHYHITESDVQKVVEAFAHCLSA